MGFLDNIKSWWGNQKQQRDQYRNSLPQINRQQARQQISQKQFVTPDNVSNMMPMGAVKSVGTRAVISVDSKIPAFRNLAQQAIDRNQIADYAADIEKYSHKMRDQYAANNARHAAAEAMKRNRASFGRAIGGRFSPTNLISRFIN